MSGRGGWGCNRGREWKAELEREGGVREEKLESSKLERGRQEVEVEGRGWRKLEKRANYALTNLSKHMTKRSLSDCWTPTVPSGVDEMFHSLLSSAIFSFKR